MAKQKTLGKLVADRTFLARRHAQLLAQSVLVEDPQLRALQASYRAEESHLERQALARRFEKLCRRVDRVELTVRQGLLAGLGPSAVLHRDGIRLEELRQLEARWERWEQRGDGFCWRVAHRAMHNVDCQRAYRRLSG